MYGANLSGTIYRYIQLYTVAFDKNVAMDYMKLLYAYIDAATVHSYSDTLRSYIIIKTELHPPSGYTLVQILRACTPTFNCEAIM